MFLKIFQAIPRSCCSRGDSQFQLFRTSLQYCSSDCYGGFNTLYWQSRLQPHLSYLSFRTYSNTKLIQKIEHINNPDNLSEQDIETLMNEHIDQYEQQQVDKMHKHTTWIPGQRKKELQMSYKLEDFPDEKNPSKWRSHLDRRCGALGIKLGMMPLWDAFGTRHPCTVIYIDSNIVMGTRTKEKDGYTAVQIGAGERKKKNVTKPLLGHYAKVGLDIEHPPYLVREFRISQSSYLPSVGTVIPARHFLPGQAVDISGITKGKGFQGGMKRHGFKGMPASHGVSKSHRSIGSTGQCQDPGRVFKGKKMPGRMGAVRRTMQNLKVVMIDRGRNLIYVRGSVPGQNGAFVEIRDAVKRPLFGSKHVKENMHEDEGREDDDNSNSHKFPPLPTWTMEKSIDGCEKGGYEVYMPVLEGREALYPEDSKF